MIPRAQQEILWFQRRFGRSQHDKQNKQTTFLHRYIIYIPVIKPCNETGLKEKKHFTWFEWVCWTFNGRKLTHPWKLLNVFMYNYLKRLLLGLMVLFLFFLCKSWFGCNF
jgi:hypothetical protein